jgi:hypothetical protein
MAGGLIPYKAQDRSTEDLIPSGLQGWITGRSLAAVYHHGSPPEDRELACSPHRFLPSPFFLFSFYSNIAA